MPTSTSTLPLLGGMTEGELVSFIANGHWKASWFIWPQPVFRAFWLARGVITAEEVAYDNLVANQRNFTLFLQHRTQTYDVLSASLLTDSTPVNCGHSGRDMKRLVVDLNGNLAKKGIIGFQIWNADEQDREILVHGIVIYLVRLLPLGEVYRLKTCLQCPVRQ